MRTVYLTRKEHFNAAHRLWNTDWSEEKNFEIFAECASPNYHGHNYDLYVTIRGVANPETGFLVNVKELGALIKEEVVEKIDHKNLNVDVEMMKGMQTTTENLAIAIWEHLEDQVREMGAELYKVQLYETEKNQVTYYGE
ncbi:MAG: 6-pyruvoyl tetrahydropterin synthase family protein [Flavobacteriales bacterium]